MANKIISYIIAVIGLAIIVLSLNLTRINLSIPPQIKPAYIMIVGIVVFILGIVLSLNESKGGKIKQAEEEVPIYHGEGKLRKIVGYRKGEK